MGSVLDCRSLASAEERLRCYDGIVDDYSAAGAGPGVNVPAELAPARPAEPAAPAAEPSGSASAAPPTADVPPEPPAAGATGSAESYFGLPPEADGRERVDQIEASIVELSLTSSGKFAFELSNGQVWRQTTTSSMRLAEGDVVVIRRGALGSHKLTKADTKRSMKVKRVR